MKTRMYKVCLQCINDLQAMRYINEHKTIKLPAAGISNGIIINCSNNPRCFDQPQRLKANEPLKKEEHFIYCTPEKCVSACKT